MRVEPWGKTGVDEAEAMFREQAQALLDGKVDLFILETFRDLNEIGAAIRRRVRSICDLPIVAQMTTEEDGASLDGAPPEQFAPELIKRGANVVGVNCSVGPAPMLETVERISDIVDVWLSAQPNAGKPRDIEGRNLYLCLAGIHGVVCAALHRLRCAPGRRLLRHDAGTHPADRAGGEVDGAGAGAAMRATAEADAVTVASQPNAQAGDRARREVGARAASW